MKRPCGDVQEAAGHEAGAPRASAVAMQGYLPWAYLLCVGSVPICRRASRGGGFLIILCTEVGGTVVLK